MRIKYFCLTIFISSLCFESFASEPAAVGGAGAPVACISKFSVVHNIVLVPYESDFIKTIANTDTNIGSCSQQKIKNEYKALFPGSNLETDGQAAFLLAQILELQQTFKKNVKCAGFKELPAVEENDLKDSLKASKTILDSLCSKSTPLNGLPTRRIDLSARPDTAEDLVCTWRINREILINANYEPTTQGLVTSIYDTSASIPEGFALGDRSIVASKRTTKEATEPCCLFTEQQAKAIALSRLLKSQSDLFYDDGVTFLRAYTMDKLSINAKSALQIAAYDFKISSDFTGLTK